MIEDTFPMLVAGDEVLNERQLLNELEQDLMMADTDSIRFLILHCTATRENRDYTVEQLLRDHRQRGFRTVGYHFYIRRSGTLTRHRRLLEAGAHCRPYNRCSIGICYEGGLDAKGRPKDTRTPEQRRRLTQLLAKLITLFPNARIVGHRDLPGTTPKECPCFDAQAEYGYLEGKR